MGLETFLFQKKGLRLTQWLFTLRKPFIEYSQPLTASVLRHNYFMTTRYYFCTMLFSIDVRWNAPPWNWRNCLLDVFIKMLLENHFTLTCWSNNFLWHSESSSTVTLLLHAEWMMVKNSSNQGGANSVTIAPWHTKSQLRMLVASKAVFLGNYLAVSTWILNGSSIACLEKKYQPFSLAGVRFGSRVNQISGLTCASHRSGLCLTLLRWNCCYKRSLWNNPHNQTNIFGLNVTLTMPRSQSCIIKSFLQG